LIVSLPTDVNVKPEMSSDQCCKLYPDTGASVPWTPKDNWDTSTIDSLPTDVNIKPEMSPDQRCNQTLDTGASVPWKPKDNMETATKPTKRSCPDVTSLFESRGNFKFMLLNIRSLPRNISEFNSQFGNCLIKLHFFVLTETWLRKEAVELYRFENFTGYHYCRIGKGGGVSIFVNNDYPLTITVDNSTFSTGGLESLVLELQNINSEKLKIIAIYRPPSSKLELFKHDLRSLLNTTIDIHCVLTGDFNIDIYKYNQKPQSNPYLESYSDLLAEFAFYHLCKIVTHSQQTSSPTCIDHVAVNFMIDQVVVKTFSFSPSDHLPVIVTITDNFFSQNSVSKPKKLVNSNLSFIDNRKLAKMLEQETWDTITHETDPTKALNTFYDIFERSLLSATKPSRHRSEPPLHKFWEGQQIKNLKKLKNKLYRKVTRNPGDERTKKFYRIIQRKYRHELDNSRTQIFAQKLQSCQTSKKAWDLIKEHIVCAENRDTTNVKSHLDDDIKTVEILTNHFQSIGLNINHEAENLLKNTNSDDTLQINDQNQNSNQNFVCEHSDPSIIRSIIDGMPRHKGPGPDGLCPKYFIENSLTLSKPVSSLINKFILLGHVPRRLKQAFIIPIHKSGNREDASNYRPISILNFLHKVLEKFIDLQLSAYLDRNLVIDPFQFGFRKNLGIINPIALFLDHIHFSLDTNKIPLAVSIDFRKAFDTCNHNIILKRLASIGFSDPTLLLFKSYLGERESRVKYKGVYGTQFVSPTGVPQGSVLGPKIFNIYINNLLQIKIEGRIMAYADDLIYINANKSVDELTLSSQSDLLKLQTQFLKLGLVANLEKTIAITFAVGRPQIPLVLFLNNTQINFVSSFKYLGLTITSSLTWSPYLSSLASQLRKVACQLLYLKKLLPAHWLNILYFALFQSRLCTYIIFWGATTKDSLSRVQSTQSIAVRIITSTSMREHVRIGTSALYLKANLQHISQLFAYKLCAFLWDNPHLRPEYESKENRPRRAHHLFRPVRTRKSHTELSIRSFTPRLLNTLNLDFNFKSRNLFLKKARNLIEASTTIGPRYANFLRPP
jgi:hypothetical protein